MDDAAVDDITEHLHGYTEITLQSQMILGFMTLHKTEVLRQNFIKLQAAECCLDHAFDLFAIYFQTTLHMDRCLQGDHLLIISHLRFFHSGEVAAGALSIFGTCGQVINTHDHILCRNSNRFTILRLQEVIRRQHQVARLGLSFS